MSTCGDETHAENNHHKNVCVDLHITGIAHLYVLRSCSYVMIQKLRCTVLTGTTCEQAMGELFLGNLGYYR